jgi:hypothetical protein
MWAKPAFYHVLRARLWHSGFVKFDEDSKYAIEIAVSVTLREILAILGPYPPPEKLLVLAIMLDIVQSVR